MEPDLHPIFADPRLLEQVITNLMTNAMNYTPCGGVVTLSTSVNIVDHSPWVTVAVKDTGLGISVEEQQHLAVKVPSLISNFSCSSSPFYGSTQIPSFVRCPASGDQV